jgi:hypothetical protein
MQPDQCHEIKCRSPDYEVRQSGRFGSQVAFSRKAASSSMPIDSKSSFAMKSPALYSLPGRFARHKRSSSLIHRERVSGF